MRLSVPIRTGRTSFFDFRPRGPAFFDFEVSAAIRDSVIRTLCIVRVALIEASVSAVRCKPFAFAWGRSPQLQTESTPSRKVTNFPKHVVYTKSWHRTSWVYD